MKGLTDIAGVRVGHASDFEGITGCTVILTPAGAVGGVDIRGSATGTEEMDLLNPLHLTERIHAVVLAGGSAFGLEAAAGVRRFLEHEGIGFDTGAAKVPLVVGAILYDLGIGKANARPTREMGQHAATLASNGPVEEGSVGAGTGATVGKLLGMKQAMKGGIGSFSMALPGENAGIRVAALAAVNALGDVIEPKTGAIVAGTRKSPETREWANSAELMKRRRQNRFGEKRNTTLVVVATNALLTKVQAQKVAQMAQHGMVRSISPVNTSSDGDLVIVLSVGQERTSVDALGVAAAEVVAESILRGVRQAKGLGGVPGLAD